MTIAAKWFWPGIAAAAALLAAAAAYRIRGQDGTITELPEEPVSSYSVRPEEVQLQAEAVRPAENDTAMLEQLPETGYLLKLRDDTLYIYEEGVRAPIAEYDLPSDWLPDYDRILLEYGFPAANKDELRQLLEDYVS